MTQYLLSRKLGGPQCNSELTGKTLPPLGFISHTFQLVVSPSTDYTIATCGINYEG